MKKIYLLHRNDITNIADAKANSLYFNLSYLNKMPKYRPNF